MIVRSPQNGHRRGRSSSGISITAASVLFSVSGSTIKRTTAGVKVGPDQSIACSAFTLPASQRRMKREYCFLPAGGRLSNCNLQHWPVYSQLSVAFLGWLGRAEHGRWDTLDISVNRADEIIYSRRG